MGKWGIISDATNKFQRSVMYALYPLSLLEILGGLWYSRDL